jgi:hypothetical protein
MCEEMLHATYHRRWVAEESICGGVIFNPSSELCASRCRYLGQALGLDYASYIRTLLYKQQICVFPLHSEWSMTVGVSGVLSDKGAPNVGLASLLSLIVLTRVRAVTVVLLNKITRSETISALV